MPPDDDDIEALLAEAEMFLNIDTNLHPSIAEYWYRFLFVLRVYLNNVEIASVNNFLDVVKILQIKKLIVLGNYRTLHAILHSIGLITCCDIINNYTDVISQKLGRNTRRSSDRQAQILVKALLERMERRYQMRIIIMGHIEGGKTTLLKRILREKFDMTETTSTNLIVTIRQGAIRTSDGEWLHNVKGTATGDIMKRMKAATHQQQISEENQNIQLQRGNTSQYADVRLSSRQMRKIKRDTKRLKIPHQFQDIPPEMWYMSLLKMRAVETDEETLCRLFFWDFAGQSIFNGLHQMFMSFRALYLIDFDISRKLTSNIEDKDVFCLGAERLMSIAEFTTFLVSSVHMYKGDTDRMCPKVILVGTHKDKVNQNVARKRMKKMKDLFAGTPLCNHIVADFILDNTDQNDQSLKRLQNKIFEVGRTECHWGEEVPASWIPLESEIIKKKERKACQILTLKEIRNINEKECYTPLHSNDEIIAFLKYHNGLGNIMFFGGNKPDDIVILDPQWLIDSFKQIITHAQFYNVPTDCTDQWNQFIESGILKKQLIKKVWRNNADTTFYKHSSKIQEILELTDIIAEPKVYDHDGMIVPQDHIFVPLMLKQNDGQDCSFEINTLLQRSKGESSHLYLVFNDKFMPPAIFQRLQAACTREYTIKKINNRSLQFYQMSVFKFNATEDFFIEHIEHTVRITVFNEHDDKLRLQTCQSVLLFIEEKMKELVMLYRKTLGDHDLPFHKAGQCEKAKGKTDALHPLGSTPNIPSVHCKDTTHDSDAIARCKKEWFGDEEKELERGICDSTPGLQSNEALCPRELGRIARKVSNTDLRKVALSFMPHVEIEHLFLENSNCLVDMNLYLLLKISKKEKEGLSTDKLTLSFTRTLEDDAGFISETFRKALADKDTTVCFEGIPNEFLDKQINDISLDHVCQKTGKEYKQFATELGIEPEDIERIILENSRIINTTRALLQLWMESARINTRSSKPSCTYRKIGQAIVEVGMDVRIVRDCYDLYLDINNSYS